MELSPDQQKAIEDLKGIEVIGLVVDDIDVGLSPDRWMRAQNFAFKDMRMSLEAAEDAIDKSPYVCNSAQHIERFQALEVALRSRRSELILVGATVYGLQGGRSMIIGTDLKPVEPGSIVKISIVTEAVFCRCQLTLIAGHPLPTGEPDDSTVMADVLTLPKPKLCSKCKKVIPKGTRYINLPLPDGKNTTPVCTTCMHKQTTVGDKGPK